MKPSHITTPRTLADCTFTQGYTSAASYPHERSHRIADAVIAAILVAVIAAIVLGVLA